MILSYIVILSITGSPVWMQTSQEIMNTLTHCIFIRDVP